MSVRVPKRTGNTSQPSGVQFALRFSLASTVKTWIIWRCAMWSKIPFKIFFTLLKEERLNDIAHCPIMQVFTVSENSNTAISAQLPNQRKKLWVIFKYFMPNTSMLGCDTRLSPSCYFSGGSLRWSHCAQGLHLGLGLRDIRRGTCWWCDGDGVDS